MSRPTHPPQLQEARKPAEILSNTIMRFLLVIFFSEKRKTKPGREDRRSLMPSAEVRNTVEITP
jgi:hypothetical protein